MAERDPLILNYSHLNNFARAPEALHTLKKVASLVKPIMRTRGWKVGELAEFFPPQANLLGLNVNHGAKILLRLRHAGDPTQFVPIEQVVDTLLHELSHIVHGPHDAKFHALWNQLRDEHEGLVMKGYTGEGFLSAGRRLGGRGRIPMQEARRLAQAAAEERAKQNARAAGSGRRLGGAAPRPGQDMRRTIAAAAERRKRTMQGCGTTGGGLGEGDIRQIEEEAARGGFRTKAEEDAANEVAIAQALMELVQEDERQKYGGYYVPPNPGQPEGSLGGAVMPNATTTSAAATVAAATSTPSPAASTSLVSSSPRLPPRGWTCEICTLHNPPTFLCCDACGTEKGASATTAVQPSSLSTPNYNEGQRRRQQQQPEAPRPAASTTTLIDLTDSPPKKKARPALSSQSQNENKSKQPDRTELSAAAVAEAAKRDVPQLWQCSFCGTLMERQWWTCSMCGSMKDNSR